MKIFPITPTIAFIAFQMAHIESQVQNCVKITQEPSVLKIFIKIVISLVTQENVHY